MMQKQQQNQQKMPTFTLCKCFVEPNDKGKIKKKIGLSHNLRMKLSFSFLSSIMGIHTHMDTWTQLENRN